MRVRLAPGASPEQAIAVIGELAASKASAVRAASQNPVDKRDDYVRWAISAEARLESVLHRDDAQSLFSNPRHRDICAMALGSQLTPLIHAELDAKAAELSDVASYLQGHLERMRASNGVPIVVDSNVLFHCQRFDTRDWPAQVKEEARVILPLRVVEEIDAKKYSESKRLRSIARRLLPWIDSLFSDGETGPVPLTEGATIELLLAERPRYRPSDADEEILDVCHHVRQFAGRVKVMTGDTGMRVRATSEGLAVLVVPQDWLRRADESLIDHEPGDHGGLEQESFGPAPQSDELPDAGSSARGVRTGQRLTDLWGQPISKRKGRKR